MGKPWARQSDNYEIDTEVYSGPLDLLLDLIQKAELDITKLAIAQVTDQFLAYIEENHGLDPEYISEFLVIASKLIQIKSEALLPRPPIHVEDEEDIGEALAQQLLIYREIKNTSSWLSARAAVNLRGYLHVAKSYPINIQFDLAGMDINNLIQAIENMLIQDQVLPASSVISIPKLTLRKKVQEILVTLHDVPNTTFHSLLGQDSSRLNIIVVFLAILELVKQDMIFTEQVGVFSDILITPNEKLLQSDEAELTIED
ncbi:MAG: segregation/condensation protein A [Anaerolineaceae bacterium]